MSTLPNDILYELIIVVVFDKRFQVLGGRLSYLIQIHKVKIVFRDVLYEQEVFFLERYTLALLNYIVPASHFVSTDSVLDELIVNKCLLSCLDRLRELWVEILDTLRFSLMQLILNLLHFAVEIVHFLLNFLAKGYLGEFWLFVLSWFAWSSFLKLALCLLKSLEELHVFFLHSQEWVLHSRVWLVDLSCLCLGQLHC